MSRETEHTRWLLPLFLTVAIAMLLTPEARLSEWRGSVQSAMTPIFRITSKLRINSRPEPASITVPLSRPVNQTEAGAPVDVKALMAEIDALRNDLVWSRSEIMRQRSTGIIPNTPARDLPGTDASVIARQIMWQEPLLGIDKGEAEGVKVNSPVMHRGAVLGRVVSSGPHAASIAPLTHRGICISARLSDCRTEGLLQGGKTENDEKLCKMTVIGREMSAKIGEQVMTSGTDGSFPAGLWMGTVCNIRKLGEMQWELTVRPACRESAVETVKVLPSQNKDVPWPRQPVRRR